MDKDILGKMQTMNPELRFEEREGGILFIYGGIPKLPSKLFFDQVTKTKEVSLILRRFEGEKSPDLLCTVQIFP